MSVLGFGASALGGLGVGFAGFGYRLEFGSAKSLLKEKCERCTPLLPARQKTESHHITGRGSKVLYDTIWGFPKIGDPNIAPEIVGSLS